MENDVLDYMTPAPRYPRRAQSATIPILVAIVSSPAITLPVYYVLDRFSTQLVINLWVLVAIPFAPAVAMGFAVYAVRRGVSGVVRIVGVIAMLMNALSIGVVYFLAWS